jgi:hypothetical protein
MVKPLWIQMCLEFPHLKDDAEFRSQIGVKFEGDNMFGESREIEQLIKKVDFVTSLGEVKETINEEEVQYFNQDYLIERWLDLSNDDIKMNKAYIKKAEEEGKEAATGGTGGTEAEAGATAEAGAEAGATGEAEAGATGGEEAEL